jgi:5-methylcytosine-specific restriction endonuclease McrA
MEGMRKEIHSFLKKDLKLELSLEKTKITHLNDGFKFLGFWIQRAMGQAGMGTKILIPKEAMDKVKDKITAITDPGTHQSSLNSTILALNRVIGGWMRYYQYTSKAATTFRKVENHAFWELAHWIGRKYQLAIPEVLQRFNKKEGLGTKEYQLGKVLSTGQYKKRFIKPNPYTTQEAKVQREELPTETYWTGHEPRPGMMDLRPIILKRDEYTCQNCGEGPLPTKELEVDHIRLVKRFKRPVDANTPDNLRILCIPCHKDKTKFDRQRESRMQ